MNRAIVLVTLVLSATPARANDRGMTVAVGGGITSGPLDGEAPQVHGGPRLLLAWEPAPIALPHRRGVRVEPVLVPELVGTSRVFADRVELGLGAGLRGELRIANRGTGRDRFTGRWAVYAAGRASVVGDTHDPQLELVLGESVAVGGGSRVGVEIGYFERRRAPASRASYDHGLVMHVYLGWQR